MEGNSSLYTTNGISLDVWVAIEDSCEVHCYVSGDQAHFELGTVEGMLHILTDVDALATLARVVNQARVTWQTVLEHDFVGFTVARDGTVEHELSTQENVRAPEEPA